MRPTLKSQVTPNYDWFKLPVVGGERITVEQQSELSQWKLMSLHSVTNALRAHPAITVCLTQPRE